MTLGRSSRVSLVSLGMLGALACGRSRGAEGTTASGKRLAERYCQSCHALPDPGLLDRPTWERWVLPRMGRRLGVKNVGWITDEAPDEGGEGGRLVREAGVYPDTQLVSYAEWEKLSAYYLQQAPASLPRPAIPNVTVGLPGFRVRVPAFHVTSPQTTLVHVDSARHRIYVGDATPGRTTLTVLDGQGRVIDSLPLPSPVSHLRVVGDTMSLLLMGRLHPSDAPRGSLHVLVGGGRVRRDTVWRVDSLRRPVFVSYADLNGDGVEDAVVSEFGNLTGRLAWYERLPGGGSRRHPMTSEPGALNTFVRDFDGDGRLDVLALTAQGEEGVSLFHGRPGGEFTREKLLRLPPSFGSTSMELADVNGDGRPDIVLANGDNGDYPSPAKPYHGVHVYLDDGRGHYAESFFFPMPGAYKAVARDFDGDGDLDIAAIAFYPDYASSAPLSFVYLENVGGMKFEAHTFADADRGRWLTMDAGDVDGDGDVDLVLGSFAQLDTQGDQRGVSARWRRPDAPTILILENTSRHR
jgi:hypothetical protein